MAYKIAIANCKGGIGKSSTALNLADQLMKAGKSVLMIDTDPQRNTTVVYKAEYLGVPTLDDIFIKGFMAEECIQHTEYGDIIAGDDSLRDADTKIAPSPKMYRYIQKSLKNIDDKYDYIIFDTPPKFGVLLGNVLECCDGIICPITCDLFGIQGITDFFELVKEFQEDNEDLKILGLLRIKYKGKQNLTADIESKLLPQYAEEMNTKVFSTPIRESVKCQEAQTMQMRLSDYAPKSTTAVDYEALAQEVMGEVEA